MEKTPTNNILASRFQILSLFRENPAIGGRRRRLLAITSFGFFSGLPFALSDATLQAWLTVEQVDLTTLGLFSLVPLPYVLKFLWAPLMDRYTPAGLGRRRGWIMLSQCFVAVVLLLMAALEPRQDLILIAGLAFILALVSASQDIAIDAYRADVLEPPERGFGAGLSVASYRVATILSGAGALVVAGALGFNTIYMMVASVMLIAIAVTWQVREPERGVSPNDIPMRPLHLAWSEPLVRLVARKEALALIAIVLLYKVGDAAAARMTLPFLVRELEFSLAEIGVLNKALGLLASLCGGIVGGALMFRFGLYRALLGFAVFQCLSNFGFIVLSLIAKSTLALAIVVTIENLAGGMGTAALVALLIALCEREYSATQFALLTGIASLPRVAIGVPAGFIAEAQGWFVFYCLTLVVALPVFIFLLKARSVIEGLDGDDQSA